MNSPLNQAHQQERKAEKLICAKKYLEALDCYKIASAFITEAMKTTETSQALISMQLQYEDHLRKQRLLHLKIERLASACATTGSNNGEQAKKTSRNMLESSEKVLETSAEVINTERSDSSFDISPQSSQELSNSGVNSSQGKTVHQPSIEDLQMQVLSVTQALEDSNRENNHLRSIVICFKEVLHAKLGFSEDEIEAMLVSHGQCQSNPNCNSETLFKPDVQVNQVSENDQNINDT